MQQEVDVGGQLRAALAAVFFAFACAAQPAAAADPVKIKVAWAVTPAHLTPYVRWLDPPAWQVFQTVHAQWLQRRREYETENLGLNQEARSA